MLVLFACASSEPEAVPSDSGRVDSGRVDSATTAHDSPHDSPSDSADSGGSNAWRSALYPGDWTPAYTDGDGRFLHDFSYAGYRASDVELPTPSGTVFDVGADATGATDATAAIQAAIDAASVSGGIVRFSAGTFRVDGTLRVTASDVVLQGAGVGSTFVFFTQATGLDYSAHLTFEGTITQGEDRPLTTDAEARATTLTLADTTGLAVGDSVAVGFTISEAFVADHGMTGTWTAFNGEWRTFFRRTITAVDATGVTIDVPLRYPVRTRDGASLRVESGYLTEVGIEGMSLSNAADWDTAWTTVQVHLLLLSGVRDAWVRDVASFASTYPTDGRGMHLASSGLKLLDSRRVTIRDVTLENAAHRGTGGNGYLFEISRSNEVLTVDSTARAGRHNFIQNWDFGTSGCVWLRTTSEDGRALLGDWDAWGYDAYSEFHHSLAMANLIDQSVATDGWQGVNRQDESTGAGHSATQNTWWNTSGGGYLRSLQYGDGYVIGTDGMDVHVDPEEWDWNDAGGGTEPEDWVEGLDQGPTLDPPSLFEDQLARRSG